MIRAAQLIGFYYIYCKKKYPKYIKYMQSTDPKRLGERLKGKRNECKLKQADLADRLSTQQSTISELEKGDRTPTTELLVSLINEFGMTADWWLFGIEPETSIVTKTPPQYTVEMPVRAMAGSGNLCCLEALEPIGHIHVPIKYNDPNITVLEISGTSMEPHIKDGAHVGIDRSDRNIVSGELYAICIPHEGIVVKRLYLGPEFVTIKSDNPIFPDQVLSIDRINWETFVQGRVKWGFLAY